MEQRSTKEVSERSSDLKDKVSAVDDLEVAVPHMAVMTRAESLGFGHQDV